MGVEKNQFLGLVDFANDKPIRQFAGPSPRQTANQHLMATALIYISDTDTNKTSSTGNGIAARNSLIFIGNEQTSSERRNGLGVVQGKVEGFCLDHHGQYHLLATLSIIKHSMEIGDRTITDLWISVLAGWLNLYSNFSSPDGQVAVPGWRAWPYKAKLQALLSTDGWHHADPGGTLSVAADTINRVWQHLPQLDNRGRKRDNQWMLRERDEEPSWQPAILFVRMLEKYPHLRGRLDNAINEGYSYPVELEMNRFRDGYFGRMAEDPKSIAPRAWGPAGAVILNWSGPKTKVSWHPGYLDETKAQSMLASM